MNDREEVSYFEDADVGEVHRSEPYALDEAGIVRFAREWNPEPFHIDPEAARRHPMGRLFAAGPHLIAIATRLTNARRPRPATVAGMGWDNLRFHRPAFAGDSLCAEITVQSKRLSQSRPGYGVVVYGLRLLNQHHEPVLSYSVTALVACHGSPA